MEEIMWYTTAYIVIALKERRKGLLVVVVL